MKFLFIHQNFPAQFRHLAPELVRQGHDVRALLPSGRRVVEMPGVSQIYYALPKPIAAASHPLLNRVQAQAIRGHGCFRRALELKEQGYEPDIIVAHPGWGEAMFLRDVWPNARQVVYGEFFYRAEGQDVGFDHELDQTTPEDRAKMRLNNTASLVSLEQAEVVISPTRWQASTFPGWAQDKITVLHDGIDTDRFVPDDRAQVAFDVAGETVAYKKGMPLITFVSRSLEPYRGIHTFLRSLVPLLNTNPEVQVAIVGADDVSYGREREDGQSWKDHFVAEIRSQLTSAQWQRVRFHGRVPVDQYRQLLQCSMVHVYLTYPFVLSWSLLEAMSTGCAIVGSKTAPVEEVITDGVTGRLVDFFEPENVAETVLELLEDPQSRKEMGANARGLVVERFDLEKVCLPQMVDLVTRQ